KPNSACSKPGNRLPSPTVKVAGSFSKVLSTTSPLSSFKAKCRVTLLSCPMRCSVIVVLFFFMQKHIHYQHASTHGNGAIGDIKSGEKPAVLPVNQNKVDDMTKEYAVIEVAECAT